MCFFLPPQPVTDVDSLIHSAWLLNNTWAYNLVGPSIKSRDFWSIFQEANTPFCEMLSHSAVQCGDAAGQRCPGILQSFWSTKQKKTQYIGRLEIASEITLNYKEQTWNYGKVLESNILQFCLDHLWDIWNLRNRNILYFTKVRLSFFSLNFSFIVKTNNSTWSTFHKSEVQNV